MKNRILTAGVRLAALLVPAAAFAQGAAAIGGTTVVVGSAIGGISDDDRPRFRTYVAEQKTLSYNYSSNLQIGTELPDSGVTYYDVPSGYGVRDYRYTVVNGRAVLVDPRTRRVVQLID